MSERKQKITPPPFTCPAISVVIPMYNAEKYIGECLDSLLAQTFKNFEVIVVDDCSTDSSCAVVESYAEKFGGRLKINQTKKNSGSGTLPRNLGLFYSHGEYMYFMDNDDVVTPTALEELYFNAKKFDADVTHCASFYMIPEKFINDAELKENLRPTKYSLVRKFTSKEPLIWENNFEERVIFFTQGKLFWNYWIQLIRRDFLIKNLIKPVGIMADDMFFTICELCCAKKYVIIPNTVYFYRERKDSLIHKTFDVPKHLNSWITMLKDGIRYLDKFLNDIEFFSRRPDLKYMLFNFFTQEMLSHLDGVYAQIPAHALDELLRKELDDDTAFTPVIFSTMSIFRLQLIQAQRQFAKFNQFAAQAQQRIAQLENEIKNVKG